MIESEQACGIQVGKIVRGVTVVHVERPGLVWVNAPPTEQSDQLLREVFKTFSFHLPVQCCLVKVEMMSLEAVKEKPTVGTLVAVRFSEDGLIYRAKVRMTQLVLAIQFLPGLIQRGCSADCSLHRLWQYRAENVEGDFQVGLL